jgi:hypothetical protein
MRWIDSISEAREFLLDFLWARMTSLGVKGAVAPGRAWIADPEVFVLAGIDVGRYDPRLFDAVASWVERSAPFIDMKRLRTLLEDRPTMVRASIAALASHIRSRDRSARWRSLAELSVRLKPKEALFRQADGTARKPFGRGDRVFSRFGLRRPPLELRETAQAIPNTGWAAVRLRMRAVFGVGIRAELVSVLLAKGQAHPAGIASRIGAASRTVSEIMRELALIGIMDGAREGRKIMYSLVQPVAWSSIAGVEPGATPGWPDWPRLLFPLCDLVRLPENSHFRKAPPDVQASRVLDFWEKLENPLRETGWCPAAPRLRRAPEAEWLHLEVGRMRERLL